MPTPTRLPLPPAQYRHAAFDRGRGRRVGRWAGLAAGLLTLLLLSSGSPRPVHAVGPEVRITPAAVTVAPGGTVVADLEVEAPANGLGAWLIDVDYTAGVLGVPTCQAFQGSLCNTAVPNTPNRVRVVGSAVPGLTGVFSLARLTFPVIGAAGTSSPLDVTVRTFADADGAPVARTVVDGQVTVALLADLSVTLSDTPDPIVATRLLTYTATVTNTGPQTATNVTLTDTIPAGLQFESATASPLGSVCSGAPALTCTLGDLASGGSATVTITGRPLAAAALSNTVSVAATETDPNSANNTATASTTVSAIPATEPKWVLQNPSAPGGPPEPRGDGSNQALGYNPANNRMVFFGGTRTNGVNHLNDTWWLHNADGTGGTPTWERIFPANPPAPRDLHAGAYDQRNDILVVYGGCLGGCTPIDTGVYALDHATGVGGTPAWRVVPTTGGPPPMRIGTTATYDSGHNRLIIFGGDNGFGGRQNAVWILDNANGVGGPAQWIGLNPAGALPAGRTGHSADYDYTNNRLIVFGGNTGGANVSNDVWVLVNANGLRTNGPQDVTAWVQLNPTGVPPAARTGHLSLYDQATNKLMIFGGIFGTSPFVVLNDVWVLSCANGLGCTPTWAPLDPFGAAVPPGRSGTLATHNSVTNRLTLWGGSTQVGYLTDLWVLENANGVFGSPSASLVVTTSVSSYPVTTGNAVTHTITVTNGGATTATGVKVVDLLPDYMDLISFAEGLIAVTPSQGTCASAEEVRAFDCNLNDIASGASATITVVMRQYQGGLRTSSIYLSANETDLVPADNSTASPETGVGDVNVSHEVDSVDALCVKRDLAGLPATAACPSPLPYPDVNLSSGVDAVDALCVERAVAGLPRTIACPVDPVVPPPPPPYTPFGPSGGLQLAAVRQAPARAAVATRPGGEGVTFRPDGPATVAAGAEAEVRVLAGGRVRPGAWTIDLAFDRAVLSAVRCASAVGQCNVSYRPGVVRLAGSAPAGLPDGAALGTVVFRAAGAAGASSPLTLSVATLAGVDGGRLSAAVTESRITIAGAARGGTPVTPTATPTPTPTASPTPTPTVCPRSGCSAPLPPTATPTATVAPRLPVSPTATPTATPSLCPRARC